MGASFAKSICKSRGPKARAASPEAEWALGWVCPAKTDRLPQSSDRPVDDPANSGGGAASDSNPHPLHDGANTENRS